MSVFLVAAIKHCLLTTSAVLLDVGRLVFLAARSRRARAAENLFLRKQLALFQERKIKPRHAHDADRWLMASLSRIFPWREALLNVKPETLIRWRRQGFRLFWRWKSKPTGRPLLPKNLRQLIREMGAENPTWGEERITDELQLKLGIRVSPRTVGKYLQGGRPVRTPDPKQRWLIFVHNHAKGIVACDFFAVVTATFRTLYVFVIMELGTRRILHQNVNRPPHGGVDPATIPRGASGRSPLSIRDPRPGHHLFQGSGQGCEGYGCASIANTGAGAQSQRRMRASGRKPAARVSGLPDPGQRAPPENDRRRVENPLQPRPAVLFTGSWSSGIEPGQDSDQWPQTPVTRRLSYREDGCVRRVTP